jgi:hypothetical protein
MRAPTTIELGIIIYLGSWLFTQFMSSLPAPSPNAGYWAKALYQFGHGLAGIAQKYQETHKPPAFVQGFIPAPTVTATQVTISDPVTTPNATVVVTTPPIQGETKQ